MSSALRFLSASQRGRSSPFACGFPLRASARRCLSSCHPAWPRQAWVLVRAAAPVAPVEVAAVVAQLRADVVRLSLGQRRAEWLAVVVAEPLRAAPTVAAVIAPPALGEQRAAARRPSARPRVAVRGGGATGCRRVVPPATLFGLSALLRRLRRWCRRSDLRRRSRSRRRALRWWRRRGDGLSALVPLARLLGPSALLGGLLRRWCRGSDLRWRSRNRRRALGWCGRWSDGFPRWSPLPGCSAFRVAPAVALPAPASVTCDGRPAFVGTFGASGAASFDHWSFRPLRPASQPRRPTADARSRRGAARPR